MVRQVFKKIGIASALLVVSVSSHATHSWSTYHIARTANPINLKVVDSVSPDWQFEFETALHEWNDSPILNMQIDSVDDTNKTRKRCRMVNGQMRVCNAAYGRNGWAGLATINIDSSGHITQGTAKMNDSYSYSDDFKRHVMCQEIGHVFGLGHTSEDGSTQHTCMDYSNSPTSISPNAHDYDLILSIYAHPDSYDSYDTDSGGGGGGGGGDGDGECKAPPGKGCNKFGSGASVSGPPIGIPVHVGRFHEVWISEDGNGGYWVHHVTLVPGSDDDHH